MVVMSGEKACCCVSNVVKSDQSGGRGTYPELVPILPQRKQRHSICICATRANAVQHLTSITRRRTNLEDACNLRAPAVTGEVCFLQMIKEVAEPVTLVHMLAI